jgi:hypothetical protein
MSTPMYRYEKALVLLLRLDAILLLTALIPSVMPIAWMKGIHGHLGLGEFPNGPLIGYLTRSLSIMYAMHGAVLLFVSLDVRRYLSVVKFIAVLGILFGLWMAALDIVVGMPLFWVVAEGPFIFLLCCVMLWLSGHVQREAR